MTTIAIIIAAILTGIATQGFTLLAAGVAAAITLFGFATFDVPVWRAAWHAVGVDD